MTSSSGTRIGVIGGCFLAGLAIVLLHLWILMVQQNEVWARRSHENRWSFRSVPSMRGAVRDRLGTVLAYDEPAIEMSVHYQRFRQFHPIGAAVHGAMLWARLQPGGEGTVYGYLPGALGPEAAIRDLLAMPAAMLRRGRLSKAAEAELSTVCTTVLAAGSGRSRSLSYRALREAMTGRRALGDVFADVPRAELEASLRRSLEFLRQLDATLVGERRARRERLGEPALADDGSILFAKLDELRRKSLDQVRTSWTDAKGQPQQGSLVESVRQTFADAVPFDLAVALRCSPLSPPGITVTPSVARVEVPAPGTSLRMLLGSVHDLDRTALGRDWFEEHVANELGDDWLGDLVPDTVADSDATLEFLRGQAKERYRRELLMRERRGVGGIESAFDSSLGGNLGMRLVERDARSREHRLWSHLRVEPGEDLKVTIDTALQAAAQAVVARHQADIEAMHGEPAAGAKVAAAIALIDAQTGDVLAYAGAPLQGTSAREVPGLWWRGNGSIGSTIKPFVLVEQLRGEAFGLPHTPIAEFHSCERSMRWGGVKLNCDATHGDRGRDAVRALAESCNVFFFQSAIGLGEDGFARALQRFGLRNAEGGDPALAAAWQPSAPGISFADPTCDPSTLLPRRGIGYGVSASPLNVARGYAGLATGFLPTLGLRLGEGRARLPLGCDTELVVVRTGLRECVQTGTGKGLSLLRDLQVEGKTGTAEIGPNKENNAWFSGYVPWNARGGVQLCFSAVVYFVPNGVHGGDAAGELVEDLFEVMRGDPALFARYLLPEQGR